jgi:hypothetical protein
MIIILVIDLCSVSLDQLQRSVHACALSEEAFRTQQCTFEFNKPCKRFSSLWNE